MGRIRSHELAEAEALLAEVAAWTTDDIDALPRLYQEKAREYRQLAKAGAAEASS